MPPLIIVAGVDEMLSDQARDFHAKALAAGVRSELILDHWFHAGELVLAIPESTRLAERLVTRIREEIPDTAGYQSQGQAKGRN